MAANKLPPMPVGIAPGSSYWNDWYEKLRTLVNNGLNVFFTNLDFTGSNLTSIATRNHNDLQNIQGGSAGQYNHLTTAQLAALTTVPPFITPTLLNAWVYFGAPYATPGYYKDAFGRVHLKGLIKNGVATSGTVLFNLPVGYRPTELLAFATSSNSAFGIINVYPNGDVAIGVGSNVWLSLDGLSFRV